MSAPVTLTGRLVADPELAFASSGVAVAKLRVVTDRRVKKGDDWESVDTTLWHVTAFKQLAEGCAEELVRGDLVLVVGQVKSREYETREGEKRTVWEVVANHVGRDLSRPRRGAASSGNQPFDRTNMSLPGDPWATSSGSDEPPF